MKILSVHCPKCDKTFKMSRKKYCIHFILCILFLKIENEMFFFVISNDLM